MKYLLIFLLFLLFNLSGCAKKEVPPLITTQPVSPPAPKIETPAPKEEAKEEKKVSLEDLLKAQDKKEEGKIDLETIKLYGRGTPPLLAIFFDFDDFSIRSDMWDRIKTNVKYLLERKEVQIILEGNCDERGTNEYNLALGMKRALEVKKALVRLGVEENRIEVVSFGEEKPVCFEQDENCFTLNRRVDFVIKTKQN